LAFWEVDSAEFRPPVSDRGDSREALLIGVSDEYVNTNLKGTRDLNPFLTLSLSLTKKIVFVKVPEEFLKKKER
jgi:hypothetical protein